MIYVVSALYIEAKAIIDKYDLKKDNSIKRFQVFGNEKIKLIISGTGRIKSALAVFYLILNNKLQENDFIINIGFCASTNKKHSLFDIVYPSKILSAYSKQAYYLDMLYKHSFCEGSLICYDTIIKNSERDSIFIDMESMGFYEAASQFFKKDKIIVLKIISDILAEKEKDRKIIDFNDENLLNISYNKIFEFIDNLQNLFSKTIYDFSIEEENFIKKIRQNLRLSDTMYYEFIYLLKYLKLSNVDMINFLKVYENIEIKNKIEGKKNFEDIKKRIIDE